MAARNVTEKPPRGVRRPAKGRGSATEAGDEQAARYRPLPTGSHGLDPELVKRDQRERLEHAMIELISQKGYPAVRIVDLARLAHVSQPTFYRLYADKEDLFLSAYDEVADHCGRTVLSAYRAAPREERLTVAMWAWAELAAAEPEATSLLVLGAFGAGAKVLERRRQTLEELERSIQASRDGAPPSAEPTDLTVKAILGGIREVTSTRLREGRVRELPMLADELAAWAGSYPRRLPSGLAVPPARRRRSPATKTPSSKRARRAEGRLPSGRSDLPRQFIVKSQRERIVDATAAIVAEKGLAALTIPEIARRANVSLQTFYDIYSSKHDAFLGAQKVGMHQALGIAVAAYEAEQRDWPRALRAGLSALIEYLASEPAHAHLSLVDTFAACPEAIEIRNSIMQAFATYVARGYELPGEHGEVPAIAAEAVVGGVWQVFHHYVEHDRVAELPAAAAQLTYFVLAPFLGPAKAARYALPDSA